MTLTSGHWLRNTATVLLSTCLIILRFLSLVLGSTELRESRPGPEESGTCMQGWLVSSSEFITWPEVMMLLDNRAFPVCATFLLLRRAIPDWVSGCMGSIYFPSTLQRTSWKSTCHCLHYHMKSLSVLIRSTAGKRRLSEVFGCFLILPISPSNPSLLSLYCSHTSYNQDSRGQMKSKTMNIPLFSL